ncbi:MAG: hypothetical protein IT385_22215 [Deltaproteobacteria bacterium]|nr:hypothetical protein [Deltaproteobacteria bacterium]
MGNGSDNTGDAIKAILGLVALLGLAYAGGHPIVQRLEVRLRISQVVTAGFPFVFIGLVASMDSVGILSEGVLGSIAPVMPLGLGFIGFAVGFRIDVKRIEDVPAGLGQAFVLTTMLPFVLIVLAAGLLLALTEGVSADAYFVRDALLLATAGAMTARTVPALLERRGAEPEVVERTVRIIQLEELVAFTGLVAVAAFFRPHEPVLGWNLPGFGWVFVTLGIGSALGIIIYALMGVASGRAETNVVTLGAIALAAGAAASLRLSPLVVCFIAGALVANLPGDFKGDMKVAIGRLERPIYLVFLMIAGARWDVGAWEGWVLMGLFVLARVAGRWLGVRMFVRMNPDELSPIERRSLAVSPMGALAVAIVVSAQDLYQGGSVPWIVTAVLAGAVVNEVIVQVLSLGRPRRITESTMIAIDVPPPVVADLPAPLPDEELPANEGDLADEARGVARGGSGEVPR